MNHRIKRLNERKQALIDASTAILDRAEAEGRDANAAEQKTMNENRVKIDELQAQLSREWATVEFMRTATPIPNEGLQLGVAPKFGTGGSGSTFLNVGTGERLQAFKHGDRMAPSTSDEPNVIGSLFRAMLTGDSGNQVLKMAAAQGNVDSQGGVLVDSYLSPMIVDLARSASVCSAAGAQSVIVPAGEMQIAKILTDPTATWRAEGVKVPASSPTFGRITLRPRTLGVIIPYTLEWLEDTANGPAALEAAAQAAMRLAVDRAALGGTGAEAQPLGLRNIEGVNSVSSVGTPADYGDVISGIQKILEANYDGQVSDLAWIRHPRDGATFDGLVDKQDQPLRPSPWASQLRPFYTTSIATTEGGGGNESYSVIGAFGEMVLGWRTNGIVVRRLPAGQVIDVNSVTHDAPAQLKELLVCYLRMDVAVLRPAWFSLLTGITVSA